MKCPRCKRECNSRYREVPKGQPAEFWCLDCILDPDKEEEFKNYEKRKKDLQMH